MPRIHEMVDSKFIKKEDCGENGILVTIRNARQHNVGTEEKPEKKWCIEFDECKPLVLNVSNMNRLEHIFKSDNTDDWIGKQVVLFNDPTVEYKGELVGGVRVDITRTINYHKRQAGQKPQEPAPPPSVGKPEDRFGDFQDDVPFMRLTNEYAIS